MFMGWPFSGRRLPRYAAASDRETPLRARVARLLGGKRPVATDNGRNDSLGGACKLLIGRGLPHDDSSLLAFCDGLRRLNIRGEVTRVQRAPHTSSPPSRFQIRRSSALPQKQMPPEGGILRGCWFETRRSVSGGHDGQRLLQALVDELLGFSSRCSSWRPLCRAR